MQVVVLSLQVLAGCDGVGTSTCPLNALTFLMPLQPSVLQATVARSRYSARGSHVERCRCCCACGCCC